MKDKLKFLIKQSFAKKTNTKWFKVVNILLLVLVIGVANIDHIINYFGGDFEEARQIYVVDQTDSNFLNFETQFTALSQSVENFSSFELIDSDESIAKLKENLNEENDNLIIEIQPDQQNYLTANLISYEPVDTITKQLITTALSTVKSEYALANSSISSEELISITSPITIKDQIINPELDEMAEAKDIMSAGVMIIFLIPFFILIILLTQMIGAEINDEKTTRGMEIIISNVPPKVHFFSKIVASTGFVLFQSLLFLVYGGIALGVRKALGGGNILSGTTATSTSISDAFNTLKNTGMLDALVKALPLIIILFILSFLIYALLAGILASMTTSIEDYQQLQSPLMILCMAGYYIALMASMFEGSIFIKIISYIPFISALVAPVIYLLGQTTIVDLIISNITLIVTCYLLFRYGIRIYKVGILNYSSKDLWKKVFKSLSQKE